MNQQPQHRFILALRHIQRSPVSLHLDYFAKPHLYLYPAPRHDSALYLLSLQLPLTDANSNFANHPDLLNHLQNP